MYGAIQQQLAGQLDEIRKAGLFKGERVLSTPQQRARRRAGPARCLEYVREQLPGPGRSSRGRQGGARGARPLGLRHGVGPVHLRHPGAAQGARAAISEFLGTEDTILYSSCFDANGGLFETLLGREDAVISDELNHASIIDGVRLCKAQRLRYKNNDMADLEAKLQESSDARFRMIATDGVFSMDGIIADLKSICDLADKYDALVMVDDSHAVGFMGKTRPGHARISRRDGPDGHPHRHARQGAGRGERRLYERSPGDRRAAAPAVAALPVLQLRGAADRGASLKAIEICRRSTELRDKLESNTKFFRAAMTERKFNIIPASTRSCRSCSATPPWRPHGRAAAREGRVRDRLSRTRSSRRARPASACRSPRPTAARQSQFAIDAFTSVRDELGL